jgi:hypothetical protein
LYGLWVTRTYAASAAAGVAIAFVAGCGSSTPRAADDDSVKAVFVRGVAQIRHTRGAKQLQARLVRTLDRLRSAHASTAAGRRAKRVAIGGLEATLKGLAAERAFYENDSGNIDAATRDSKRADRYSKRGANLLRAAGRALGIRVGALNRY